MLFSGSEMNTSVRFKYMLQNRPARGLTASKNCFLTNYGISHYFNFKRELLMNSSSKLVSICSELSIHVPLKRHYRHTIQVLCFPTALSPNNSKLGMEGVRGRYNPSQPIRRYNMGRRGPSHLPCPNSLDKTSLRKVSLTQIK